MNIENDDMEIGFNKGSAIYYLNTDLDIRSMHDITSIIETLKDDIFLLHHGEIEDFQHAVFEIPAAYKLTADEAINQLCALIEKLPDDARDVWDKCFARTFDIGYQSGISPNSFGSEISSATLARIAALGASILITIYPVREESDAIKQSNIEDSQD